MPAQANFRSSTRVLRILIIMSGKYRYHIPMLTSSLVKQSTNLCRRFERIDRSRMSFSDFSVLSCEDSLGRLVEASGDVSERLGSRWRISCKGSTI